LRTGIADLDGPPKMFRRLERFHAREEEFPKLLVRVWIVRVGVERCPRNRLGFHDAPISQQQFGEAGIRPALLRSDRHCSSQRLLRGLIVSAPELDQSLDLKRVDVLPILAQNLHGGCVSSVEHSDTECLARLPNPLRRIREIHAPAQLTSFPKYRAPEPASAKLERDTLFAHRDPCSAFRLASASTYGSCRSTFQ
jgi:hypothetical protein